MQKKVRFFYLLALLAGFALRIGLIEHTSIMEYDDSISLLAATGHEGEYGLLSQQQGYPIGEWVPASAWKRFIEPEPGRGFAQIAADLAAWDVHPPLFFWILHVWMKFTGNQLASLQALNLVIDLLTASTMVWIGWRVLPDIRYALAASAGWLLGPNALLTSIHIRQYSFLSLLTLLFSYLFYRLFFDPHRPRHPFRMAFWLGLVTLSALLTYYYSALFLISGAALLLAKSLAKKERLTGAVSLFAFLGLTSLLFVLFFHGFRSSLENYIASKLIFSTSWTELSIRLHRVLITVPFLAAPLFLSLGIVLVFFTIGKFGSRFQMDTAIQAMQRRGREPFFVWLAWFAQLTFLAIVLLYLVGVSQRHTMSHRYLGYLSPLVALIAVFLLARLRQERLLFLYVAGLILLGASTFLFHIRRDQVGQIDWQEVNAQPAALIDTVEWGNWPVALQYLQPNLPVHLNHQDNLIARPDKWRPQLCSTGGVFISFVRSNENTEIRRRQILELIQAECAVRKLSQMIDQRRKIVVYAVERQGGP